MSPEAQLLYAAACGNTDKKADHIRIQPRLCRQHLLAFQVHSRNEGQLEGMMLLYGEVLICEACAITVHHITLGGQVDEVRTLL